MAVSGFRASVLRRESDAVTIGGESYYLSAVPFRVFALDPMASVRVDLWALGGDPAPVLDVAHARACARFDSRFTPKLRAQGMSWLLSGASGPACAGTPSAIGSWEDLRHYLQAESPANAVRLRLTGPAPVEAAVIAFIPAPAPATTPITLSMSADGGSPASYETVLSITPRSTWPAWLTTLVIAVVGAGLGLGSAMIQQFLHKRSDDKKAFQAAITAGEYNEFYEAYWNLAGGARPDEEKVDLLLRHLQVSGVLAGLPRREVRKIDRVVRMPPTEGLKSLNTLIARRFGALGHPSR